VHFAAGAALGAMRNARIVGRPWSLTAHAYEIFATPANLREKLADAAFTTTGCRYNLEHLRGLGAERVHEVVMGVDAERFTRARPHPEDGFVLAVGRLVEKKGFVHLVRAAAAVPNARIVIVGEGEQRAALEAEMERLGVGDRVTLAGRREHGDVRELLERAAVLAMPAVVASDGDRDSMPVVVKEALAMEVPVVASDEVGLPEIVRPEFGRLVPPGDEAALAAALAELLALSAEERAAMGRAGRGFVKMHADSRRETEKLSELLCMATR
jgi:glycosyltransferase involved in cell wall biosynthesis